MSSSNRVIALIQRTGFPTDLAGGFLAVVIFVIGDGIEAVWITNYLSSDAVGFAVDSASKIVTTYGVMVAIAAFLSGALCDAIGPRKVMLIGVVSFLIFDALFIAVALPSQSIALVYLTYGMRGFGYPMLAYGFLTWVMMVTPPARQSSASGWFWFAFSLGMQIIGSYLSAQMLPLFGHIVTLWFGWVLAAVGGAATLLFLRGHASASHSKGISVLTSLSGAVSILWRHPKVSLMGIVKVINLAGQYGMQVYYIVYLQKVYGMAESSAILTFTVFGVVAVVGDVVWGVLGDRFGWRNTLQWVATPVTAVSLAYLYVIPMVAGPSFWLISLGMAGVGIGLSAHVPTTPLIMAHAKGETGNALAILNFGAGLGTFVGPGLVALFIGNENTAGGYLGPGMALAGIYVLSFVILFWLRLPGNARVLHSQAEVRDVSAPTAPAAH